MSERADGPRLRLGLYESQDPLSVLFTDHQHCPETTVKRSAHLFFTQTTLALKPREHGRYTPARCIWNIKTMSKKRSRSRWISSFYIVVLHCAPKGAAHPDPPSVLEEELEECSPEVHRRWCGRRLSPHRCAGLAEAAGCRSLSVWATHHLYNNTRVMSQNTLKHVTLWCHAIIPMFCPGCPNGAGELYWRPDRSRTFRTRLKPLLWIPDEATPMSRSPSVMSFNLGRTVPRSTAPTQNPARSYSPGAYTPGISAVSPPDQTRETLNDLNSHSTTSNHNDT